MWVEAVRLLAGMYGPRLIVEGREGSGALRVPLQGKHADGHLAARPRLGLSIVSAGKHARYKCSDEVRRALRCPTTSALVILDYSLWIFTWWRPEPRWRR